MAKSVIFPYFQHFVFILLTKLVQVVLHVYMSTKASFGRARCASKLVFLICRLSKKFRAIATIRSDLQA